MDVRHPGRPSGIVKGLSTGGDVPVQYDEFPCFSVNWGPLQRGWI